MNVTIDGRCACCSGPITTGGCSTCNSVRVSCSCGALLACGCGRTFVHAVCPNIKLVGELVPPVIISTSTVTP